MSVDVNEVSPLSVPTPSIVPKNEDSGKPANLAHATISPILPTLRIGQQYGAWSILDATDNHKTFYSWSHGCRVKPCSYRHESNNRDPELPVYYRMRCECGTVKVTNNPRESKRCPHCRNIDKQWHCNTCRWSWYSQQKEPWCARCGNKAERGTCPVKPRSIGSGFMGVTCHGCKQTWNSTKDHTIPECPICGPVIAKYLARQEVA